MGRFIRIGRPIQIAESNRDNGCARNHDVMLPYYFDEPTPKKRAEVVWSLIDIAFPRPITRSDDTGDYAATQIIAELFKSAGFGGVAYKSNFGKEGLNLALFDIDVTDLVNCHLYQVKSVEMEFSREHDCSYFVKKHCDKD